MKWKITLLVVLFITIVSMLSYLWMTQGNDTMVMKHWLELLILEGMLLEFFALFKSVLKPKKNNATIQERKNSV